MRRIHFNGPLYTHWSAFTAHSKAVVMGPFDPRIILRVSNQETKSRFWGRQARAVAAVKLKYANTAVIKGGRTYLRGGGRPLTHKSSWRFLCAPPPSLQGSFYVPSENCLQRAHTWHRRLCRLLLAAHRGLHAYHVALMKEIPQLQQTPLDPGTNVVKLCERFKWRLQWSLFQGRAS